MNIKIVGSGGDYVVVVPRSTKSRALALIRFLEEKGFGNCELRREIDKHESVMTLGHRIDEDDDC